MTVTINNKTYDINNDDDFKQVVQLLWTGELPKDANNE
jgi:citrate synthase